MHFKMKFLKLTLLVLNVACVKVTAGAKSEKVFKFDRFIQCPGYKNLTFIVEKITFFRVERMYAMSMKFKILKTSSDQLKLRLQLSRCRSRESLDTCESIPDFVFSTVCMIINIKLPPFSSSMNAIQPTLRCPMEKGSYVMSNNTIDELTLKVLPLEGWYWKVYSYLYDKVDGIEKTVLCIYTEFSIV